MTGFRITDWDDAYENGGNIVGSADFLSALAGEAQAFRNGVRCSLDVAYGDADREAYDLFLPDAAPKGLFVFVHGGYWQKTDKSMWSHYAKGAVENGWATLVPGYTLCPENTVDGIVGQVASAINHAAAAIDGPIVLTGHSAGGHVVACLSAMGTRLDAETAERVLHTVPISGLADLRPLVVTKLNDALKLDVASAAETSPALMRPLDGVRLTAWVGAVERSEFLRQNALMASIWRGLGAWTQAIEEPDKHHFNVIDGLLDAQSPLMKTALHFS